jgi:hypothetical protein
MAVKRKWIAAAVCLALLSARLSFNCEARGQAVEAHFKAADSPRVLTDDDARTRAALEQFAWEPAEFDVRCTATPGLAYDALVRFPSPMPSGDRWVDEVVLQWYAARGADGKAIEAPAVLLVHSLHPRMVIANQIAQAFARRGLHAFMIQLPGYGLRWSGAGHHGVTALEHGRQGVADCLRARDAIRALPNSKPGPIALQGTSLGGFVAATAAGIDPMFDPVILLISGGDGYGSLTHGLHDALYLRQALERRGYHGDALRDLLEPVEPLRVAHRLNPNRTWLISASDDVTIPKTSSDALVRAVGLDDTHHLTLNATHYTIVVRLPAITDYMADIILGMDHDPPLTPDPVPQQ